MNVTIQSNQVLQSPHGESVSESTREDTLGFLREEKDGLVLEYANDKGIKGLRKIITLSIFNDNIVTVNHFGAMDEYMVFEEGKNHTCIYESDPLPVQLKIQTNKLKNNITFEGGKLSVDYTVLIAGSVAERSQVTLSLSPYRNRISS